MYTRLVRAQWYPHWRDGEPLMCRGRADDEQTLVPDVLVGAQ